MARELIGRRRVFFLAFAVVMPFLLWWATVEAGGSTMDIIWGELCLFLILCSYAFLELVVAPRLISRSRLGTRRMVAVVAVILLTLIPFAMHWIPKSGFEHPAKSFNPWLILYIGILVLWVSAELVQWLRQKRQGTY